MAGEIKNRLMHRSLILMRSLRWFCQNTDQIKSKISWFPLPAYFSGRVYFVFIWQDFSLRGEGNLHNVSVWGEKPNNSAHPW